MRRKCEPATVTAAGAQYPLPPTSPRSWLSRKRAGFGTELHSQTFPQPEPFLPSTQASLHTGEIRRGSVNLPQRLPTPAANTPIRTYQLQGSIIGMTPGHGASQRPGVLSTKT
ncbi:hypothetical protein O3P69_009980 [Scylla paramamosain]|uniref:Uncharacterized protein n=1 Tax=Scylla paramamosain TaxID=85552 RepID=A0AAW0SNK7_SCYPA